MGLQILGPFLAAAAIGLTLGIMLLRRRFSGSTTFLSMLLTFLVVCAAFGRTPIGFLASAGGMLILLFVLVLYLGVAFGRDLLSTE
jgi:hypothetical protein